MASPKEELDTPICLDDIRQKLSAITDTELALDILNNLEKLENQLADKTAIIAEKAVRETTLQQINSQLFAKVSAFNDTQKPASTVDYTDINRDLAKIIDKL